MNFISQSLKKGSLRSSTRQFSYLTALEEFKIPVKVQPGASVAPIAKTSVLGSGISVSTKGHAGPIANLTFSVASGSVAEDAGSKGVAHFLGNTGFIGTANKSGLRLARDLENIGAVFNSSADREKITYSVKVMNDQVETAFALLTEVISSSPRAAYLLDEARETVALDYRKLSCPATLVSELIHEAAFGETGYGASVFADSIEEVDSQNVLSFRKSNYTAGNLNIVADGVNHESLVALTECYFNGFPAGKSTPVNAKYVGGELKIKSFTVGKTVYSGLAFPVSVENSTDFKVVFDSLQQAFKNNTNIIPFINLYNGAGLIGVRTYGESAVVAENLQLAIKHIKQIASSQANAESSAKKVLLEQALCTDKTSGSVVCKPAAVTAATVAAAANSMLKSKPTFVVLGKSLSNPSYSQVVEWLK